jgi:hypothetical protein
MVFNSFLQLNIDAFKTIYRKHHFGSDIPFTQPQQTQPTDSSIEVVKTNFFQ